MGQEDHSFGIIAAASKSNIAACVSGNWSVTSSKPNKYFNNSFVGKTDILFK